MPSPLPTSRPGFIPRAARPYNPRPLAQRITSMRKPAVPGTPAAAPAPAGPTIPRVQPLDPLPTADPATTDFYARSLYGTLKNPSVEASPLYEWRKNEALKTLKGDLAARGQTDSGFEQDQRLRAVDQLSAEEAARIDANRQHEADRLQGSLDTEAARRQDVDFRGRDDLFHLLEMGMGAYKPGEVPDSVNQWSELEKAIGDANGMIAGAGRGGGGGGRSGGGGGGGSGSIPPPVPYFPPGPDRTMSGQASILGNASSSAGYGNLASSLFSYLLR